MRSKRIEGRWNNDRFLPMVIVSARLRFLPRRLFSSAYYRSPLILCLLIAGCESTPQRPPAVDGVAVDSQTVVSKPDPPSNGQQPGVYTVQKGDTFYSIALNHGIDQKDLVEWNNIQDPTAIHIGQQLNLSSPSHLAQPSLFALPDAAPSPQAGTGPIVPAFEEKHMVNTDKLKFEPKAFKLPYSEQAVALLKGTAGTPGTTVGTPAIAALNAEPTAAKDPGTEISPAPPATEAIRGADDVEWIWPAKGKVLDGFTESTKGIDIAGKPGQPVSASAAGKVVYSGAGLRGYGKLIIIKHNNTYLSAYAHNSKLLVKEGETVAKGQKIAEMGSTDTSSVKLHFEIRKNGKPVDPLKHLPGISG